MRRLKIGIRPQLMMLVSFASLFSLLILAIVTGVYFSSNLSGLRAERLVVISELRATQVKQAFDYIYYQVNGLAVKDTIQNPLSSYRAGNNSDVIFASAQTSLDQFVQSSELFISARLYNLDLSVVAKSENEEISINNSTRYFLYPLNKNASIPPPLLNMTANSQEQQVFLTGPIANTTDMDSPYFMGMTLPVYANSSIIFPDPTLSGYLSILVNATNIQQAANDTSVLTASSSYESKDYSVILIQPIWGTLEDGMQLDYKLYNNSEIIGFRPIFPTLDSVMAPNQIYNINESSAIKEALSRPNQGSATNVKSIDQEPVAIGFFSIDIDSTRDWTLIIQQKRSRFLGPTRKFTKIIIGVVIGIGAFMCLITFPLAWYFVKPITQLKDATEAITGSKKRRDLNGDEIPPPYFTPRDEAKDSANQDLEKIYRQNNHPENNDNGSITLVNRSNALDKRALIVSSNAESAHSSAIRLPNRLKNSKKFFKDELTELTEAFNIMTEELDKQYTHLEDRVKLRTKELEASKSEAEKANEAKTVFIANISHELRTPLNGILGMTAIAMDENDQTRIHDSLKLINRSGELLLHILTELLTYSKNTLNRSKLEKSNFQILEVVYQVKSIFSKLAFDSKVNFSVILRPRILRKLILHGDSNRIIQILMNLVSNALKFTPVDGSVKVTFRLLGEYDYEKSKEDNFTEVHILKDIHNRPLPTIPTKTHSNSRRESFSSKQDHTNGNPTSHSGENLNRTFSKTGVRDFENDCNSNDNTSILTLPTAEYENVMLRSQFNHSKPLPQSPESKFEIIAESTDFDANANIPSGSAVNEHPQDPLKRNSVPNLEKNPSFFQFPNTDLTTRSNSFDAVVDEEKLHRVSSLYHREKGIAHQMAYERRKSNSSLSRQEIVKDGKAYKIRHLYKPKTWVLQVDVKDTGTGIEPALQDKVFEPFIQGDQTLSRSYGGTGLGLSICRQLAFMMNGTLKLKSVIGAGSTFTFTVPLLQRGEIMVDNDDLEDFCQDEFNETISKMSEVEEVSVEEHASEEQHSNADEKIDQNVDVPKIKVTNEKDSLLSRNNSGLDVSSSVKKGRKFNLDIPSKASIFEKPHLITRSSTGTANSSAGEKEYTDIMQELKHIRILVAEDNLVNQEVIKRMLKLEGFENVTMAANGADAVELVKDSYETLELFDLIFMDVQMPKIDGLLATKMIRNNLKFDAPIIALTAFADESNVKECLNAGMTGFLAKPFRRTNLRQIITQYAPILLREIVTTPLTLHSDEKRLGYPNSSHSTTSFNKSPGT